MPPAITCDMGIWLYMGPHDRVGVHKERCNVSKEMYFPSQREYFNCK